VVSEVDLIVAALVAGAGAGVTSTASSVVQDAYSGLKNLLVTRLGGRSRAQAVLRAEQVEPGGFDTLREEVSGSGAADDAQIIAAARRLLELTGAPQTRPTAQTVAGSAVGGAIIQVSRVGGAVRIGPAHTTPPASPAPEPLLAPAAGDRLPDGDDDGDRPGDQSVTRTSTTGPVYQVTDAGSLDVER
jgi:hypothetical protein